MLPEMLTGAEGHGLRFWLLAMLGAGALGACGPAEKAPATPVKKAAPVASSAAIASPPAPEPAVPPLRTGTLEPVDDPAREARLRRRGDDGPYEILELELLLANGQRQRIGAPDDPLESRWPMTFVGLEPPSGQSTFVDYFSDPADAGERSLAIWVRRKKSPDPVEGTLYTAASSAPAHRVPFHASVDPKLKPDPTLRQEWAAALAKSLSYSDGPDEFTARRLLTVYGESPKPTSPAPAAWDRAKGRARARTDDAYEFARLMDTTSGRVSVQRALEYDRELFVRAKKERASVPLSDVKPPNLARHPWAALVKALGKNVPDEPLARAVPAEFYLLRARDFGKFLDLLDLVESFGEPAADLLDGHPEDRATFTRYETELALERTELTRLFGPDVVTDLAIAGSDPYVHEGSDVTLIFRVKNTPLFTSALAGALAHHAVLHPNIAQSSFTTDGTTVTVRRSADGRVRQHRATVGGFELVSNSAAAMRRVIATIAGKHPSLAAEPDFAYMLARDAGPPDDVLAFLGERFIASVVGPQQKIAEARRQLALSELLVPGYAALALGRIDGQAPKSTADLVRSKFLARSELKHADGSPIDFEPGRAARSAWGSPAALEPLLERPAPARVTATERDAYRLFASGYESLWSDRIDPVALRVSESTTKDGRSVTADLRVLPTLRNEYRDDIELVGQAHLAVSRLLPGFSAAVGIGADARLRRTLTELGTVFGSDHHLAFDWVGDYAVVGVAPRNELLNAVRGEVSSHIELPHDAPRARFRDKIAGLPLYAVLGVKSRVGAGLCLTALRGLAREAAPGAVEWGRAPDYRGTDVVAIRFSEDGIHGALYYALTEHALVLSSNEAVLHQALDLVTDNPPRSVPARDAAASDAAQLVVELGSKPGDALLRSVAWLAAAAATDDEREARQLAASVLLGAPDQTGDAAAARLLMREYLGTVVVTPSGQSYSLAEDGIRDPDRGTPNAPIFPELPVLGSPLERVLNAFRRVRTALSFDEEPAVTGERPLSSLHARVTLELNPATQPGTK